MRTSHCALLLGLLLCGALAFGTFSQLFLVLIFGALGVAVGVLIEGRIEIRGITDRWGN